MPKLTDLGEIREIELEGSWSLRPSLGSLDDTRRIVSQYLCNDNDLWFFQAEERTMLSAASGAIVWQVFSAVRSAQDQNRELMPSELRKLSEVLKGKTNSREFSIISARLRLLSGRMVLHVAGKHIETQSDHNCILLPKRTLQGWHVQELGFRFSNSWHKKTPLPNCRSYGKIISAAWNTVQWNNAMPPLYVPSKTQATGNNNVALAIDGQLCS